MAIRIPILYRISILFNVIVLLSMLINYRHSNKAKIPSKKWNDQVIASFHRSLNNQPSLFNSYTNIPPIAQRGKYWVLYNYIKAETAFGDFDSVTYSTHSDYTYLDNLEPLLERWMGPVSIALYSPGTDFKESIRRIMYLRECSQSSLVKSYVTFHLFFDSGQFPSSQVPHDFVPVDCNSPPDFGDNLQTYRKSHNLPYPINVARNVAREMSTTFFVLASDIELYPSPNLTHHFLEMIKSDNFKILKESQNPKVFVLPIFEIEKNISKLPQDKSELQELLSSKLAVPFHLFVCEYCHQIPKQNQWISTKQEPNLGIFHIGKRERQFNRWEPIYIGTKFDPNYDERLSWEGQKDKMTQGFILCMLRYEFHILNNAFLIHRPGIKRLTNPEPSPAQKFWLTQTNNLILKTIVPELRILYGRHKNCYV